MLTSYCSIRFFDRFASPVDIFNVTAFVGLDSIDRRAVSLQAVVTLNRAERCAHMI
jgi:hypothetical protein